MNGIDYALLASVANSGLLADGTLSPFWAACKTFSEVIGVVSAALLLWAWLRGLLRHIQTWDVQPPNSPAPASAKVLSRPEQVAQRMRELRLTVIDGAKDVLSWLSAAARGKRPVPCSHAGPRGMAELLFDARRLSVVANVEIKDHLAMRAAGLMQAVADLGKAWALSARTKAEGDAHTDDGRPVVGMPRLPMGSLVDGLALMGQDLMTRDRFGRRGAVKDVNLPLRHAHILLVRALGVVIGLAANEDVSRPAMA